MRPGHLILILTVPVAAAAVTLLPPGPASAKASEVPERPTPSPPRALVAAACEITATASVRGSAPRIEVVVSNREARPVEVAVVLMLHTSRPASPLSRVVRPPRRVWEHVLTASMKPRQTWTFALFPDVALREGEIAQLLARCGDRTRLLATLAVKPGAPAEAG